MRDLQHWKDKVELSLDGRQVFFLFFGGAVLACMLFALGVMTGRRLEARAIALDAPSTEDPLAALDQLGDLEDEELTYHRTLTRDRNRVKQTASSSSSPPAAASASSTASSEEEHAPPAVRANAAARPTPAPRAPAQSPPANAIAAPANEVSETPAAPTPAPVRPTPRQAAVAQNPLKGDNKDSASDAAQPRFSLQLSSFTAKHDADDFMHRAQTAGYRAFVISSDVPGKGVMYRVRLGDFASKDAAMAMKGSVDSKLKVSAILAKQ